MPTTTVRQSQWPQRITIVAAIGLLIVSWFFAYIWLMALTEGVLVPWDTTTIRPPHGNWQRTVNDFFEAGIGAYLPSLTFLVVNAALFTWGARRAKRIAWLATAFALTNVGAFVLLLPLSLALQSFVHATPPQLRPDDWRYLGDFARTWPLVVVGIAMVVALSAGQALMVRRMSADQR